MGYADHLDHVRHATSLPQRGAGGPDVEVEVVEEPAVDGHDAAAAEELHGTGHVGRRCPVAGADVERRLGPVRTEVLPDEPPLFAVHPGRVADVGDQLAKG